MAKQTLESIRTLMSHITFSLFGQDFYIITELDKSYGKRPYLQVYYHAPCAKTGNIERWSGRKWYLSPHMTDDEIVKTAWAAAQAAVEHEIKEGFKFDNIVLFNPHVDFRKILEISPHEVKREENFDV